DQHARLQCAGEQLRAGCAGFVVVLVRITRARTSGAAAWLADSRVSAKASQIDWVSDDEGRAAMRKQCRANSGAVIIAAASAAAVLGLQPPVRGQAYFSATGSFGATAGQFQDFLFTTTPTSAVALRTWASNGGF